MTSSTSLIKMCSDLQRSLLNEVLHEFDKNVLREVAEPVKEVLHEFDKNVLRKVVTALGLRRIRKTYQEFRDCAIIIRRRGAEKLELSSKNLDSTPPPKPKKLGLTPSVMLKITSHPPPTTHPPPPPHTHTTLTATITIDAFK